MNPNKSESCTPPRPGRWRLLALGATLCAATLACVTLGGAPPGPTLPAPLQWRQDLGTTSMSPPALADGLMIFKYGVTAFVARQAANGAEKWRYPVYNSPTLQRPPAVDSGRVFLEDSPVDGAQQPHTQLLALDMQTGRLAWQAKVADGEQAGLYIQPVAADGVVYYESVPNGSMHVLMAADAASGTVRWQSLLTALVLASDPVIDGGQLYAQLSPIAPISDSQSAETLVDIDTASGQLRWTAAVAEGSTSSLAAGNGRVYLTTREGDCVAFDEATGAQGWSFHVDDINPTAPVLAGDSVYFGDVNGNLTALDAATGALRWQVQLGSRVPARAAVSGGRVYVGTMDGILFALDVTNGQEIWRAPSPLNKSWPTPYVPPLDTEPVVGGGSLYFFNGTELVALTIP